MNFLSHYYFDRSADNYQVLGSILPDLIKNAVKNVHLHPEKNENQFTGIPAEHSLLKGWKSHLAVDKYFHSSEFFAEQTALIKALVTPLTISTPVRPSFLAHIALELTLDHLLLKKNLVNVNDLYQSLEATNPKTVAAFLSKAGMKNPGALTRFLSEFILNRYLKSYDRIENIGYALNRICMRLWPQSLDEPKIIELSRILNIYAAGIESTFLEIFEAIERKLAPQY